MESETHCDKYEVAGYDAASIRAEIPGKGPPRRYHIHPTALQPQVRRAVREAGITKKVTPHTFRHSAAPHLLQAGYDIRTTMIYLHIRKNEQKPLRSPLDILRENESQTPKGGAGQDKNRREANCRNWPV